MTRLWSTGSRWVRWDPHLHAPGTLLNDQFGGDWDAYFEAIRAADPPAEVIGVTDYFTLRSYKEFLQRKDAAGLPDLVIFPNVEMRLTVETREGQGINIHLLVSPDDPNHVSAIEERLARLLFRFRDRAYPCTDDGLKALGREHSGDRSLPEDAAIKVGANQFKVDLGLLGQLFTDDSWMRQNVLVAVAAGNDGLSGLSRDAGFAASREELGRFASIVFSGQESDRAYWLGRHPDFARNWQTPKPCLHGSDAHAVQDVLKPALDRRCWIRGDLTFESLRQARVEPERRVHIGDYPPPGPPASLVAERLTVGNAPWLKVADLALNPGLVTVIGAKGSGKTALADLLALGAGSREAAPGPASFIAKAGSLLSGLAARVAWGDSGESTASIDEVVATEEQRVQYLSQQFVERLSSPTDLSEPLVREIERVVFSAIPEEDRLEAAGFEDLREATLTDLTAAREFEQENIRRLTGKVAAEQELQRSLPVLESKANAAADYRDGIQKAIEALPVRADATIVEAHRKAADNLRRLKDAVAAAEKRARHLAEIKAELERELRTADTWLSELKAKYSGALDEADWTLLQPRVSDTALLRLDELISGARARSAELREVGLPADDGAAHTGGIEALEAAVAAAEGALGLDTANVRRRAEMEQQLLKARVDETASAQSVANARGASDRIRAAHGSRLASYTEVFRTLVAEEGALVSLYQPLRDQIAADERLSKLAFVVERSVDATEWAARGERMVDLRRNPFGSEGLLAAAERHLQEAWQAGSPEDASEGMRAFIEAHGSDATRCLLRNYSPADFGQWLFSTHHIKVRYGILYDGVELNRLSPGTRGVVLLTLYLALDKWDMRPLVIDQPEENLDPSSVNDELVPFFRDAATRRQIVMVTHNANLVVNTDSDQVIVATSERTLPTELPEVSYEAGGLEDPIIRAHVCRLLEGGEAAFKKRGQRYGIAE